MVKRLFNSFKNLAKWYFNTAAKAYGDAVDNYSNVFVG